MARSYSILAAGIVTVFAFAAASVNAQTESPPVPVPQAGHSTMGGGHKHSEKGAKNTNPACQQIQADCKEAGYIVGQWKKDNGLWKDCFDRIMKGETPTRYGKPDPMNVNQNVVQECKQAIHHKGNSVPATAR